MPVGDAPVGDGEGHELAGQETLFSVEDSFLEPDANAILGGSLPTGGSDVPPLHLRRLWCRNLKGFEDVDLELDSFSVLVGTNSSGKSTLLQAISLVHRLLQVHAVEGETEVEFGGGGRLILAEILPVAAARDLWFERRQRVGRSEHVEVVVGVEYENGLRFEFGIRGLFGSLNSRVIEAPDKVPLDDYMRITARPPVIVPAAVGVVAQEEYRTPARRAGLLASGRQNEIIRNHLEAIERSKPDAFQSMGDILETHFGARVRDVVFNPDRDQFISAIYAAGSVEHDLFSAGGGFLQILQLLTFAFAYDAGLLALDEPDAHLHSSLQQIVVRILETLGTENGTQVVLATHSKEIINFVDSGRLIPVRKGARELRPLRPYQSAIELLQDVGAVDNVDAYSLLLTRRCAFVEGRSDERVLKRFASKMGSTVFEGDSKVVLLRTGGVTEVRHLQQLDVFEGMIGGRIASLQVIDRDGLPGRLLDEVEARASRPVHILSRDSLENYLVEVEPLHRVIQAELSRRGSDLSVSDDEVAAIVGECAEALKDDTIDRATTAIESFYLIHRREDRPGAAEMAKEAREYVESRWQNVDDKLALVPGKPLLAGVREVVQERVHVSFTTDRLAAEFSVEEIPEEIADIVHTLENLAP